MKASIKSASLLSPIARSGLIGHVARNPARPQVVQHAHASKALVFHPRGGVDFGETPVVEVSDVLEPIDHGVRIRGVRGPHAQL
jgi:hypothetical protein